MIKIELFKSGIVLNSIGLDKPITTEKGIIKRIDPILTTLTNEGRRDYWLDCLRVINLKIKELDRDLVFFSKRGDYNSVERKEIEAMRFYAEKVRLVASLQAEKYKELLTMNETEEV